MYFLLHKKVHLGLRKQTEDSNIDMSSFGELARRGGYMRNKHAGDFSVHCEISWANGNDWQLIDQRY